MLIDILGKIKEKKLAYNNTLLPLFEAIINSIQAIEEGSATKPGIISVEMNRVPQITMNLEGGSSKPQILSFIIRDNGVGFTDETLIHLTMRTQLIS